MLLAADYYIEKEDLFIIAEDQKIRLVSLWSVVLLLCKDMFCLKSIILALKEKNYDPKKGRIGHHKQKIFNTWQFIIGELETFQSQCNCVFPIIIIYSYTLATK